MDSGNQSLEYDGAMIINFKIGDKEAAFERDMIFGRATVRSGETSVELQNPKHLSTHYSFKLVRTWECILDGHKVSVEQKRPALIGGLRKMSYRVFVDGHLVAEENGR